MCNCETYTRVIYACFHMCVLSSFAMHTRTINTFFVWQHIIMCVFCTFRHYASHDMRHICDRFTLCATIERDYHVIVVSHIDAYCTWIVICNFSFMCAISIVRAFRAHSIYAYFAFATYRNAHNCVSIFVTNFACNIQQDTCMLHTIACTIQRDVCNIQSVGCV